jgi:hypothetical protein
MLLQSIDHYEYLPFAIAVLPRTLESSSGALCEPQISENTRYFKSHRVKELKFSLELAVMAHRGSRGIGQSHAPATLSPAERSGTQCTGGWLSPSPISPVPGCDTPIVQSVASQVSQGSRMKLISTSMLTSTNTVSECGLHRIQGSLLLTHCIHIKSQYGVRHQVLEYSFLCSARV